MEFLVCLEKTDNNLCIFDCCHKNYHLACIKGVSKCPMCRNKKLSSNSEDNVNINRILVWHYNQILPATLYKNAKNLNCEIVVISNLSEKKPNDLVYHFN